MAALEVNDLGARSYPSISDMLASYAAARAALWDSKHAVVDLGIDLHRRPPDSPPKPKIKLAPVAAPPLPVSIETLPSRINSRQIIEIVAKHYGVYPVQICSRERRFRILWPRQVACYIIRKGLGLSLPEIGRRLGGRDHSTVLHSVRKVDKAMLGDQATVNEIAGLMRSCRF